MMTTLRYLSLHEEEENWEDPEDWKDQDEYDSSEEDEEDFEEEKVWDSLPNQVRDVRFIQSFLHLTTGWEQGSTLKLKDGVTHEVQDLDPENDCSLVQLHLAYGQSYYRLFPLLSWSCGSLKHLSLNTGSMPDPPQLQFPNLLAFQWRGAGSNAPLQLPEWVTESLKLKVVHFIPMLLNVVYLGELPLSTEQIWISDLFPKRRREAPRNIVAHLHRLAISMPRVEHLRVENFFFLEEKIIDLLKARQAAANEGNQIEGVPISCSKCSLWILLSSSLILYWRLNSWWKSWTSTTLQG